jgi:16S rRNA processing protein RimM
LKPPPKKRLWLKKHLPQKKRQLKKRLRANPLSADTVTLAAVSGAHGVTGEVRLKLFTDSFDSLKRHKSFNNGKLTVQSLRPHKGGAIVRFIEVTDRNAAEALRSTVLQVERDALPSLAEGEYYFSDLIGVPCVSTTGEDLGECVAVENFGASDVIEIKKPDGNKFMVPMNADAVPEWGAQIVIDAAFVI